LIAKEYGLGIFRFIKTEAIFKEYAIGMCRLGAIEEYRDKDH
jgi:hypothetical protein